MKWQFPDYNLFEGREGIFETDKRDYFIAGHGIFEAAGLPGDIHEGYAPDLGVVLGRDGDFGKGVAWSAATPELRLVWREVPGVARLR